MSASERRARCARTALTAALLAGLLGACHPADPVVHTHAIDLSWRFAQQTPDFTLTDANGKAHRLSDFRGKVVALFFGYTHCPDVCPTTLASLARVMRTLGPAAAEVQVLFITVDPERDTAAVLAGYTPYFNPSFIGLRGDAAATQQAATVFAVTYGKRPADSGEYAMDHSANTYLISRSGRTVLMSPYGEPDAVLADDLRQLLAMPH